MKLFSRKQQQAQPIIPPELQPYYQMQSHQKSMWRNRQVMLPLVVIVVALFVIGAVVWQIVDHTTSSNSSGRNQGASQSPQSNSTENKTGKPAATPSTDKTNTTPIQDPAN
ncbi:MAG: hypothetical protein ABIR37_03640 [Candidatus Saccharimonadales bacterium]